MWNKLVQVMLLESLKLSMLAQTNCDYKAMKDVFGFF